MITNVTYGIAIFAAFIKENIWEITEKLRKILISNSCNSKNIIARAMKFCMNIPCVLARGLCVKVHELCLDWCLSSGKFECEPER